MDDDSDKRISQTANKDTKQVEESFDPLDEDKNKGDLDITPVKRAKTDGGRSITGESSVTGNSDKKKNKPSMTFAAGHKLTLKIQESTNYLDDDLLLDNRPNIDKSQIKEKDK